MLIIGSILVCKHTAEKSLNLFQKWGEKDQMGEILIERERE